MKFDHYEIRPLVVKDAVAYFAMIDRNRERLSRFFPKTVAATHDLQATVAYLEQRTMLAEKREFFTYAIVDVINGIIVGTVSLKNIAWEIPKAELGYMIDQDVEGKGLVTQAIACLILHAFDVLGINKLYARIAEENVGSRRVVEKNGFLVEGILRRDHRSLDGELLDVVYYGLLNPGI